MVSHVEPASNLSPIWSTLIAYGVGGIIVVMMVISLVRWLKSSLDAAIARAAHQADGELHEGPVIVAGKVEHARGKRTAVKVEITQTGTESESSGVWSHRWTEVDRRVRVKPFYLRRATGERIRVQPTEDVFLVDEMDGCILVNAIRRTRTVELVSGESVIAKGVLSRAIDPEGGPVGDRQSAMGWLLQRSPREPILLSTEPLEQRFVRQRRFHFRWLVGFGVALIVTQLVLFQFHRRQFAGETVEAEVVVKRHYVTTDGDGDDEHNYEVTAQLPWGVNLFSRVDASDFEAVTKGGTVAVLHIDTRFPVFGSQPTLMFFHAVLVLGALAFAIGRYLLALRRARPWWAGKVVNAGSGRLDSKTGLEKPT